MKACDRLWKLFCYLKIRVTWPSMIFARSAQNINGISQRPIFRGKCRSVPPKHTTHALTAKHNYRTKTSLSIAKKDTKDASSYFYYSRLLYDTTGPQKTSLHFSSLLSRLSSCYNRTISLYLSIYLSIHLPRVVYMKYV